MLLVCYASTSTSDGCRRERRGEDETGSVGADHVNEFFRAGNVPSNSAVCLSKSTSDDVNTIHDRTRDGCTALTRCSMSLVVQVFSDASAAGSIQTDGVNLLTTDEHQL